MLGSSGNVMLQMMSAPEAAILSMQDRSAADVLRRARIAHGSRMATLAHVNRVVDERSGSRQRRTSLIRMQFDRSKPNVSVFDDTAYAYGEVCVYTDSDGSGTADGSSSESDNDDGSTPRNKSAGSSGPVSRTNSAAWCPAGSRPQSSSAQSINAANSSSRRSSSRRNLTDGNLSFNPNLNPTPGPTSPIQTVTETIKPCEEEGEELFAKGTVRFRDPAVDNSTGGSGGGTPHPHLYKPGAPAAPSAAWAEESPTAAAGGGVGVGGSVGTPGASPWDSESAAAFAWSLPSHINDAWSKAAVSPQPGSALATLLASSPHPSWRPRGMRTSAPGAALPSLRASATAAAGAASAASPDGSQQPRSSSSLYIAASAAAVPSVSFLQSSPSKSCLLSSESSSHASSGHSLGAVKTIAFTVPPATAAAAASLSPVSSMSPAHPNCPPSPASANPQPQTPQQQAACTSGGAGLPPPPRAARGDRVYMPVPVTTLPQITTPTSGSNSRTASPNPAAACGRPTSGYARDIPTASGRRSATGTSAAPAAAGFLSSSWSGTSWPRPSSGSSSRGAGTPTEEQLGGVNRSAAAGFASRRLRSPAPGATGGRAGPLLRPAPKGLASALATIAAVAAFEECVLAISATSQGAAAATSASGSQPPLSTPPAPQPPQPQPPSTQPQTPQQQTPLGRRSLTLLPAQSPRAAASDASAPGPQPQPTPPMRSPSPQPQPAPQQAACPPQPSFTIAAVAAAAARAPSPGAFTHLDFGSLRPTSRASSEEKRRQRRESSSGAQHQHHQYHPQSGQAHPHPQPPAPAHQYPPPPYPYAAAHRIQQHQHQQQPSVSIAPAAGLPPTVPQQHSQALGRYGNTGNGNGVGSQQQQHAQAATICNALPPRPS